MGVTVQTIYLDSCIVIYLVEEHPIFFEPIKRAIAASGDARLCISPLVELECLVGPLKSSDALLEADYEQFFAELSRLGIPEEIYRDAAMLRAKHGVKTPDALHVAIALYHSCTHLWTNDDRLAKAVGTFAVNVLAGVQTDPLAP